MSYSGSILRGVVLTAGVFWPFLGQPGEVRAADALDEMVAAFKGNPTRSQIQSQLNTALHLYGLPLEDKSYSEASIILTKLRKDTGTSEMDTLSCINGSQLHLSTVSFDDAAAICATPLPPVPLPPDLPTEPRN